MEDWIELLNEYAATLLNNADELNELIEEQVSEVIKQEDIPHFKEIFGNMCNALTLIVGILDGENAPLPRLIKELSGIDLPAHKVDLEDFLKSHHEMLMKIGAPPRLIKQLLDMMSQESIETPQTVTQENGENFKREINELRNIICSMHQNVEKIDNALNLEVARACVKGTMGASLIVVDVTGAFMVPDMTGFVLYKAVKSTWTGYRWVVDGVKRLRKSWRW